MLLNKHIGYDEREGMGIDGSLFQAELLRLDNMGKNRIQVWINSPGGIVMDGYNIFNAILKSKTKVDTYNVGIAASIAAVIFQAGRKRVMADYSLLMYHNPYGGGNNELKKMQVSIATMISERTQTDVEEVLRMMERTTWITGSEALIAGFCDEIEYSKEINAKHGNAKALWDAGMVVVNSFIKPKNKINMNKVANMLNLNAEASEEAIVAEILEIQNKKMSAEEKMKKMEAAYNEAQEKCDKMKAELDAYKQKMEDAIAKAEAEEAESKKSKAKNMVEGFVRTGKIKNDSVEKWTNMAIADFDNVKNLLEELPTNGKSVTPETQHTVSDAELTMVAAKAMQEVRNKLKI
jgi:ATP-dependent protease ClpP protease subunit/phage shock protein A